MRNLKSLRSLLVEGREDLCAALAKDLHKSHAESYFTEMNLIEHEIEHMMGHLNRYMAAETVGTDLLNLGGTSQIYPEALGVVCVIGAWNYPVQLTIMPCVGALAAGNTVLVKVCCQTQTKNKHGLNRETEQERQRQRGRNRDSYGNTKHTGRYPVSLQTL